MNFGKFRYLKELKLDYYYPFFLLVCMGYPVTSRTRDSIVIYIYVYIYR